MCYLLDMLWFLLDIFLDRGYIGSSVCSFTFRYASYVVYWDNSNASYVALWNNSDASYVAWYENSNASYVAL